MLNYEFIKGEFIKEGYTLVDSVYINSTTKLNYICPNEHRHSITWNKWKSGRRCFYCAGQVSPDIEYIRDLFLKEGYILLSKIYVNNRTKIECLCPNGHKIGVSWSNWLKGRRCGICFGNNKPSIHSITLSFVSKGYKLLSYNYKNSQTKLDYICPNGNTHSIKYGHWQQGHGCPCYKCQEQRHIKHSLTVSNHFHPNWKGGISFEPYCEIWKDKEYKSDIKTRDDNRCLNPYCYLKDKILSIHHVDYDKKNCHPNNLITLCRSCNSKANTDREWHKQWYQTVLSKRYGYVY